MDHLDDKHLRLKLVAHGEVAPVLALLFPHAGANQRRQLATQHHAAEPPRLLLWAAYRGSRLCGALRIHVQPGRTAVVAAPSLVSAEPRETSLALLRRGLERLAAEGVQWVQALSSPGDAQETRLWQAAGFRYVTDLAYLVSLSANFPTEPADGLTFTPYSPQLHARLSQVIERTYIDSLDCQSVGFSRPVDEVLAGYRALGPFDPARWLVASDGASGSVGDVGCLLLADDPDNKQWELVYLGVVPEARSRGLGLTMTRHAQWLTRCAGRGRLVLAVDATNSPALRVYDAAGFVGWDKRSVFVREL
jgi:mycothiol synthase